MFLIYKDQVQQLFFDITITNVGTIGAELIGINLTGDDHDDIIVTYPEFPVGTILMPNEDYDFNITVEWDEASTTENHDLVFEVSLDYQQDY